MLSERHQNLPGRLSGAGPRMLCHNSAVEAPLMTSRAVDALTNVLCNSQDVVVELHWMGWN
jgi:hypothetical protein